MSDIAINQVLTQMRLLQAASTGGIESGTNKVASSLGGGEQFSQLLADSIGKVNQAQSQAEALKMAYQRGDEGVDLPQVMVALQEASVSFQAMTQVRNRLLSAYQDIMNMPV